ncbi:acyl-CoA thioesterase [Robertkochia flava]|uniref:acyl-CoA thioesterase n=1 Tax=Robertkochia flava TaxID=3447986 RepID=UPI001CCEDEA8|nr:thioesterase family protein [Robertkochia marina]
MKIYEYVITVGREDIDELEHVNNVRYVQWVQDAAEAHWNALATDEMKARYIWMVLSHQISYKGQAFEQDRIRIKTYVTHSEGVTSRRVVEMYQEPSNRLLVKAQTDWCLLGKESKRPARLTEALIELFQ